MQQLQDIMTTDVQTCSPKDNVYEAACIMRDFHVGIVPVVEADQRCIGVITDRDIVVRGIAEKREGSAAIKEVMSDDITFGHPGMTADEAARIMSERKIRRLPVVENEKLVGMVAIGDLAVRDEYAGQAGVALSDISSPTRQLQQ